VPDYLLVKLVADDVLTVKSVEPWSVWLRGMPPSAS
jgi:hypothetical protein